MPPVIRVSEATWERLKAWATPLEDSADDAMQKVLDAAENHRGSALPSKSGDNDRRSEASGTPAQRRLPKGQKVTNREFEGPILDVLYQLGGRAPMGEVLDGVGKKMSHLFGPVDYELTQSGGDIRWRNTAQWARNTLVHKLGLMRDDSPRGIWELSSKGVAEVEGRRAR